MILLINISNPEFIQAPPLGLLYVGGALKRAGYEVEVQHFPPGDMAAKAREIVARNPQFVGFSAFTCDQTTYAARLSQAIKAISDTTIVWGGVHASMVPDQTLSESYIDVVVIGEGEETIGELADAIDHKTDLSEVKGIGFKRSGEKIFTETRPLIKNLDEYPLDWDLVDVERYLIPLWGKKRVLNYITSRGCPHKCGFCYNLYFNRGRWRGHSRELVISQLQMLKQKYGVDGVRFNDDNFFANKKRAIDILEAIDLSWEGSLRIGYITEEVARQLRDTKCEGICFGFESGNDRILELINKDQTVETIKSGVSILAKYPEVRVSGTLILANPTETREEVRNTVNFCLELWKIHPKMSFSLGIFLPFPGAPLYDLVTAAGYVPPACTEDWEVLDRGNENMVISWLPWVTKKDIKDFVYARRYAQLLSLGNLNIPLLNRIPYWRLSHYNFTLPVELGPLSWILKKYVDRSSKLGTAVRKLLPFLRRQRSSSR